MVDYQSCFRHLKQRLPVLMLWVFLLSNVFVYASETDQSKGKTSNPILRFCYESETFVPFTIDSQQASSSRTGITLPFGEHGVLVDLAIGAAQRIGHHPVFITRPWKRCIRLLENGSVDGIFAAIWLEKRDHWGRFPKQNDQVDHSRRLWSVSYSVYVNRVSDVSWDGVGFSNLFTGLSAPLGYVVTERLKQLDAYSQSSYSAKDGLNTVAKGRLDGYVVESELGDALVRQLGLGRQLRKLRIPFIKANWHLPLSHQWVDKHPEQAELFWRALQQQRESQADMLLQQYRKSN